MSNDLSVHHVNNNLKASIAFAKYLGPEVSFHDITSQQQVLSFLDSKRKSADDDPEMKWITTAGVIHHVVLEAFIDNTDGMNGGEWKKLFEFTYNGTWNSFLPYMHGRSCMVSTDGVTDFRIKKLSIRTIDSLSQDPAQTLRT